MRRLAVLLALLVAGCAPARVVTPELPVREGYLEAADPVRLFYRVVGTGTDTVVVVHGFQGNSMSYLYGDLLPLARRHTVVFYDQRGGGRSDPVLDAARLGIDDHVRDLEAVRRYFGLQHAALLGHSGGAGIAARYALRYPGRVTRLLLVAPIPPVRDPYAAESQRRFLARVDTAAFARANALQDSLASASDPAAVCRQIARIMLPSAFFKDSTAFRRTRGDFCSAPPAALRTERMRLAAFQRSLGVWDWRSELTGLRVPVLVIHGAHDAIPVAASRAWTAALPDARLLVFEQSDHLPFAEVPAVFSAAADTFLGGRWPAGAQRAR